MDGQKFLRGQVWFTQSPDYAVGSVQKGARPVVIVSSNQYNQFTRTLTVVPLTSQDKPERPTHVDIDFEDHPSTILCEQIRTAAVEEMRFYLYTVTDEKMSEIEKAIRAQLDMLGAALVAE